MLKKILIGLGIAVLAFAAVGFVLPGEYRVARSVVVEAPPEAVFPLINDLNQWSSWTIWSARDPEMKIEISGGGEGEGAIQRWHSESQGSGELTITNSVQNESITYALYFPEFESRSTGRIVLEPVTGGTRVTWSDEGELGHNPLIRWFGLFFDSMIGSDFAAGLARLKAHVEGSAVPNA
jgi:hypothetical protein